MDSGDNPFYKNRPSTRVHAAPGGKSSICFGDEVPTASLHNSFSSRADAFSARSTCKEGVHDEQQQQLHASSVPSSARLYANTAPNPTQKQQNAETARTSVKVHQPPGGRSTIQFG